ncbi:TPM domain-containing protein, partial [Sodalinema sp.]|uniref:TPM domain-containing protein n=1 Tax=Sodalinema sp. TaxID=3080550 RepID=UPI00396F72B4
MPNPQELHGTWVSDMADILSEDTERQLNQMISALEAENGAEIAVVTVANTNSQPTPKAFATRLLNYWGVGKAELDNGVLFLNSVGDRRVEIDTGYGIEEILPDAQVGDILDQEILPKFRNNDFDAGTLAGVEAIIMALSGDVFASPAGVIGGARSGISVRELVYSPLSLYVISVITLCATPVCIYKRTRRILEHPPKFLPMGRSRVLDPKCHGLYKTPVTSLYLLSFFLCLAVFTLTLILDPSGRLWVAAMVILGVFVISR